MTGSENRSEILFAIETTLGFRVRTTREYWTLITTIKHPALRGRLDAVMEALRNPEEIRVSKSDPSVYLFYRGDGRSRWVCAVARKLNDDGFLITAYRTSNIKEGQRLWPK